MKFLVLATIAAVCFCVPLITRDATEELKKLVTWEVVDYEDNIFKGWTKDEIKRMLGTHKRHTNVQNEAANSFSVPLAPTSFDARDKWPTCIHPVRNQGNCGSCWAFAATNQLSDRYCIKGKDLVLSPQYVIECDSDDDCCDGGYLDSSFAFLEKTGTVEDKCLPYDMNCARCREVNCVHYKCKAGSISTPKNNDKTMDEIYKNGPIEGAFDVYRDFLSYRSGVYYHKTGELLGGHAISVLGFGVEDGLNYWLCKNSWGATWGMSGYFKIKMGNCGIDEDMITCAPDL
jgi:cathepsin B